MGFGFEVTCMYLEVSTGNSFLYIGQMKYRPTEVAKKCENQRSHRLTPPSNDGLVTKKTQKHGALIARPRFLLLKSHIVGKGRTVEEMPCCSYCSEAKSSSDKFKRNVRELWQEPYYTLCVWQAQLTTALSDNFPCWDSLQMTCSWRRWHWSSRFSLVIMFKLPRLG